LSLIEFIWMSDTFMSGGFPLAFPNVV
jgi:hypothetical protein